MKKILSRHLHPLLKRPYIFIISSHVKGLSLHEGMNDSETNIFYDDIQIQNNTKDCIVLIVRFNYSSLYGPVRHNAHLYIEILYPLS